MARQKTYQYRIEDSPVTLAQQNGITPQQLINANPGGYPFQTGQNIILPNRRLPPTDPTRGRIGGGQNYLATNSYSPFSYTLNTNNAGEQIQQGAQQFGPLGAVYAAGNVASNLGVQAVQNIGQAANYLGGQYREAYSNVPDEVIHALAFINPGLAKSFLDARPEGRGPKRVNPAERSETFNDTNAQSQVWENEINNAMNSATPLAQMSPFAAQSLGIDPQKAGYIMQSGMWVYNKDYAALQAAGGATPSFTPDPNAPTTDNNWQTNPALHQVTWNKYAKNPKNRFQTNLKWAQNAMRRQAGKGKNRQNQPGATIQQDANITGFGLVNFGASAG